MHDYTLQISTRCSMLARQKLAAMSGMLLLANAQSQAKLQLSLLQSATEVPFPISLPSSTKLASNCMAIAHRKGSMPPQHLLIERGDQASPSTNLTRPSSSMMRASSVSTLSSASALATAAPCSAAVSLCWSCCTSSITAPCSCPPWP